jgi:hypothetical protein
VADVTTPAPALPVPMMPVLPPTRLSGEQSATAETIEAEITAVNNEFGKRGEPWPNAKKTSTLVGERLRDRGLTVKRDYIYELAMQEKFNTKRRRVGSH